MECRKNELVKDVPGLYAVADVTLDGKEYYAAASENRGGRVYLVDPVTQKATELFGGQGGVMAILDVKGENAVLFIEEFYPVFDSATAKVIKADLEKKDDGYEVSKRTVLAEIPYVHRISLLQEKDGVYLAAGKLCKSKTDQDDWSTSGTMEIGKYDPTKDKVEMEQIYDGVTKHHAMFVARNKEGFDDLYFGGTEGVFRATCKDGEWNVEHLLSVPTSDIVYMDLDGDGKEELAIIEEFHGNKAVVFKKLGAGMERMVEIPLSFGHVLWGGQFFGRPALITGSRAGDKTLRIFEHKKEDDNKKDIVDLKDKERVLPTKEEHKRMTIPGLIGSVIGVLVGIVPGTGGDISALISWDVCKRVSRHPEEFGDGSVEGLATTCASNNASIGGALTTALALGIPGDGNTAVLLGALTMYGMVTGPTLLSNSAPFVCRLYIIMIIANLIILPLGLLSAKACIRLLSIKSQYIQMAVLLICCVGAYSMNRNYTDVIVMFIAGICGFFFRKYDYPLGPMILGLLLGDMCETNLRRTLMLSNGSYLQLFTGPISIGLIVLILLAIGWPFISNLFQKKKNKKVEG